MYTKVYLRYKTIFCRVIAIYITYDFFIRGKLDVSFSRYRAVGSFFMGWGRGGEEAE